MSNQLHGFTNKSHDENTQLLLSQKKLKEIAKKRQRNNLLDSSTSVLEKYRTERKLRNHHSHASHSAFKSDTSDFIFRNDVVQRVSVSPKRAIEQTEEQKMAEARQHIKSSVDVDLPVKQNLITRQNSNRVQLTPIESPVHMRSSSNLLAQPSQLQMPNLSPSPSRALSNIRPRH